MSWTMWHICGPGFDVSGVPDEKWESFLENHRVSVEKVYDGEFQNELSDAVKASGSSPELPLTQRLQEITENGTAAIVAACIMQTETGIRFSSPGLTDGGEDCVMFLDASPWEYNDRERKLTQEELFGIMKKYAGELGTKFDPDLDLIYAG